MNSRIENDNLIKKLIDNHGLRAQADGTIEVNRNGVWKKAPAYTSPSGYQRIILRVDGKIKKFNVHRIVLIYFVGVSELECDHIDKNKFNNSLSNLRYVTRSQNTKGRITVQPKRAFTDEELVDIRELYANGVSKGEIARIYAVSHKVISDRLVRDYADYSRKRANVLRLHQENTKYFVNGVPLVDLCKQCKVHYSSVISRMKRLNECPEDAFNYYMKRKNQEAA